MSDHPAPFDLEDFFDNGPIPFHLVATDGTILKANRAELEFLGYSADEYVGRNIAEFYADQSVVEDILARLLRGEILRSYEARMRAKDGTIKHVLIDSSGHFQHGKVSHTLCFTRDVTGPKALETERQKVMASERAARERAEQLNRDKDEFLAMLSHELRTPLNAVLGWVKLLEAEASISDKVRHGIEVIGRNVAVQMRLIDELLDLSRVMSGKIRIEIRHLNLLSVVEAAAETFKPSATAKGIQLQMVLASEAGEIFGDPERLQQVMGNLISNAIKFTPKGGRVHITLERVNSSVEVRVADTGIGIAADFLPHVFDRFRQANDTSSKDHRGLGIGLAIAQHLVQLHGGTLEASSPGINQGAVFTVKLPIMASTPSAVRNAVLRTEDAPGGGSPPQSPGSHGR